MNKQNLSNGEKYETHDLKRPLITFGLFAYNQERFIRAALKGAFAQTYSPLEIILSDDCSSDRTYEIMREMAAAYIGPHAVILNCNERNLGLGGNINRVVAMSRGSWLVFAGGDDISLPNRVSDSLRIIEEHGEVGGVFGRYHKFYEKFKDVGNWTPNLTTDNSAIKCNNLEWLHRLERGENLAMPGCVAMWNRKLFDIFGELPEGVITEDVVLGYRSLFCRLGLAYTSSHFTLYRIHQNNVCSGQNYSVYCRKYFYSTAVIHRDLFRLKKDAPSCYSNIEWHQLITEIEKMVFKTLANSRVNESGLIRSIIVLLVGVKKERMKARLRQIKQVIRGYLDYSKNPEV
jgi:glycosyltransferase involved in cell wall biosynthesis